MTDGIKQKIAPMIVASKTASNRAVFNAFGALPLSKYLFLSFKVSGARILS